MLTLSSLRIWRALCAGPDGADPCAVIQAERRSLLAVLDEVIAGREGWRDIASAPRDEEILAALILDGRLFWAESTTWRYLPSRYGSKPGAGYWMPRSADGAPTHWMPLPSAPQPREPTNDR